MRKIKLFCLCGFVLLVSCEKILEFDFPECEPVPVLNALFSDVNGMELSLTNSYMMSDLHMDYALLDADIYLLENNEYVDTLVKDATCYLSDYEMQPGNNYGIVADSPDFATISVADYIPEKPVVNSMEIIDSVFVEFDGSVVFQLNFEFEDDPLTNDYYEFVIYSQFLMEENGELKENNWTAPLSSENDPVLLNENLLEFDSRFFVFSDELFSDKGGYVMNANFRPPSFDYISDFQFFLIFRHVSHDYYMYKKQCIKHFDNQENDIFEGLGQPVQMYSNIEGGLGIFAGFSQVVESLNWEK